jgi:hypothetical protein
MEMIFRFYSLVSVATFCLKQICNENPAETERNVSTLLFFFNEVGDAASNSAYYGYPELWILRYPAHRYHMP